MVLLKRISIYLGRLKDFSGICEELSKNYRLPTVFFILDALMCRMVHGSSPEQYFDFAMYRMNHRERKQYMTNRRAVRLTNLLNGSKKNEDVLDKCSFNRNYAAYIHREWMYGPEHTDEEILGMLSRHEAVVTKYPLQNKGEGIQKKQSAAVLEAPADFLREVREEKLLIEECIRQHPVLERLNPSSVNTIRLCTVRDRTGDPHLFAASLRVGGKDQFVDNLHANGVQYPIDIEKGFVSGGGASYDGKRNICFHPSTNVQVIGLMIPHWKEIVAAILEAAHIPASTRYIGWDVAVTEEGFELIEANDRQGSNGMQLDGVGKYPIIRQYI